jgi:hypothetical protein
MLYQSCKSIVKRVGVVSGLLFSVMIRSAYASEPVEGSIGTLGSFGTDRTIGTIAGCGKVVGESFSSNRHRGLEPGTLQLALWYDGDVVPSSPVVFEFELQNASGSLQWVAVGDAQDKLGFITAFSKIVTREYRLGACRPTGKVRISGMKPNGVIDGMAVGLLFRDESNRYRLWRSSRLQPSVELDYVGMWPLGMVDSWWTERAPQITGFGLEQLKVMLHGASYLDNGEWVLP